MPVVARVDPKTVFTPEEWSRLTSRSSLRGMWLVVHAWGTIAAAIALVTLWPNPLTWLIAVTVVGARQLGLAILMHEAAHAGLHANRAINEWVGQWLCAVPVGADLASYRSYHLQHHKFTQQPEDPDLSLSAPFPITKESFTRKAIRDLTGQTFVKQRLPAFLSLFRPADTEDRLSHDSFVSSGADKMARFLAVNALLFLRRVGARDGHLAAAGDPYPQHRRTRLHLYRRRPVQPRPHDPRQSDRAAVDRALLGELPRRASSLYVFAMLSATGSAPAAGRERPDRADGSASRISRRDAAGDLKSAGLIKAFSSEVDTGSRKENASKQKTRA